MPSTHPALSEFNARITRPSLGAGLNGFSFDISGSSPANVDRAFESEVARPDLVGREQLQARLARVEAAIKARTERSKFFPKDLFADPAWDMLLELTRSELVGHRISITSLCCAAHVPATTALRYITTLTAQGMLLRRPDPLDGRRVFVELSAPALTSMFQYLDSTE